MSTLFLIRHGLTAQTGKTLYGRTEGIPLDDRGLAQALGLAERFAALRLTAVYSSPLERCVQSVAPLAQAQRLEVVPRPGLIEMDAGSWTGKPLSRLRRTTLWKEVQTSPSTFRFPGVASPSPRRRRAWWRRCRPSRSGTAAAAWPWPPTATSSGSC